MDIWAWTYDVVDSLRKNGNDRLADAMYDIGSYTCDDNHDKVDLLYPEALSLAKKESNQWIEIFIRHWHLQSQVLHRHNVKDTLNEAVDLLEFSSQENNSDCPQSICVVQDLANTYAQKDGPAYTQERIAVSLETLERINPSWPCYDCISDEYISALIDANELNVALKEISFRREEMIKANNLSERTAFCLDESYILIKQGQYKQAEKSIKVAENPYGGESFVRKKSAVTALALAYQGKFEEASEFVLSFSEVLKAPSHYIDWCEYKYLECKAGRIEGFEELNHCLNTITKSFITNGVQRDTLTILAWQIELALLIDDVFTVQQCVLTAQSIIPELAKDLGATEQFSDFEQKCQLVIEKSTNTFTVSEEKIVEQLKQGESQSLSYFKFATESFPDNLTIQIAFFDCLVKNGYIQMALTFALGQLNQSPDSLRLLNRYGCLLLDESLYSDFDFFFAEERFITVKNDVKHTYLWLSARRYYQADVNKSLTFLQQILDIFPHSENALERSASLLASTGHYQLAQDYWTRLIEIDKRNRHFHWDRMVSATIKKNWQSVRESCKVLDIKLDSGEDVIRQNMGKIRIQIDDNGDLVNILANRIGPVEAEICGIRELNRKQFIGSTIVFDPLALNKLDQKDEQGYRCDAEGYYTSLFRQFKITNVCEHFVFDLDGLDPDDNDWDRLLALLKGFDGVLSVRSSQDYTVTKKGSKKELKAIYSFVACPANTDLHKLNRALKKWSTSINLPFVWPMLLEKLEDIEELKIQAKLEELYGLN